jgi:hypothetical protein
MNKQVLEDAEALHKMHMESSLQNGAFKTLDQSEEEDPQDISEKFKFEKRPSR